MIGKVLVVVVVYLVVGVIVSLVENFVRAVRGEGKDSASGVLMTILLYPLLLAVWSYIVVLSIVIGVGDGIRGWSQERKKSHKDRSIDS